MSNRNTAGGYAAGHERRLSSRRSMQQGGPTRRQSSTTPRRGSTPPPTPVSKGSGENLSTAFAKRNLAKPEAKISAVEKNIGHIDSLGRPQDLKAEVLFLSGNVLRSLSGIERFANLRILSAGSNYLASFDSLTPLLSLPKLEVLSLINNPVTQLPFYRSWLLANCPTLTSVDNKVVTAKDRKRSIEFIKKEVSLLENMYVNHAFIMKAEHAVSMIQLLGTLPGRDTPSGLSGLSFLTASLESWVAYNPPENVSAQLRKEVRRARLIHIGSSSDREIDSVVGWKSAYDSVLDSQQISIEESYNRLTRTINNTYGVTVSSVVPMNKFKEIADSLISKQSKIGATSSRTLPPQQVDPGTPLALNINTERLEEAQKKHMQRMMLSRKHLPDPHCHRHGSRSGSVSPSDSLVAEGLQEHFRLKVENTSLDEKRLSEGLEHKSHLSDRSASPHEAIFKEGIESYRREQEAKREPGHQQHQHQHQHQHEEIEKERDLLEAARGEVMMQEINKALRTELDKYQEALKKVGDQQKVKNRQHKDRESELLQKLTSAEETATITLNELDAAKEQILHWRSKASEYLTEVQHLRTTKHDEDQQTQFQIQSLKDELSNHRKETNDKQLSDLQAERDHWKAKSSELMMKYQTGSEEDEIDKKATKQLILSLRNERDHWKAKASEVIFEGEDEDTTEMNKLISTLQSERDYWKEKASFHPEDQSDNTRLMMSLRNERDHWKTRATELMSEYQDFSTLQNERDYWKEKASEKASSTTPPKSPSTPEATKRLVNSLKSERDHWKAKSSEHLRELNKIKLEDHNQGDVAFWKERAEKLTQEMQVLSEHLAEAQEQNDQDQDNASQPIIDFLVMKRTFSKFKAAAKNSIQINSAREILNHTQASLKVSKTLRAWRRLAKIDKYVSIGHKMHAYHLLNSYYRKLVRAMQNRVVTTKVNKLTSAWDTWMAVKGGKNLKGKISKPASKSKTSAANESFDNFQSGSTEELREVITVVPQRPQKHSIRYSNGKYTRSPPHADHLSQDEVTSDSEHVPPPVPSSSIPDHALYSTWLQRQSANKHQPEDQTQQKYLALAFSGWRRQAAVQKHHRFTSNVSLQLFKKRQNSIKSKSFHLWLTALNKRRMLNHLEKQLQRKKAERLVRSSFGKWTSSCVASLLRYKSEKQILTDELQTQKDRLAQLGLSNIRLVDSLSQAVGKAATLEVNLETKSTALRDLTQELNTCRASRTAMKSQIKGAKNRDAEKNVKLKLLENEILTADGCVAEQEARQLLLTNENTHKITTLSNQLMSAQGGINTLQDQLRLTQEQLQNAHETGASTTTAMLKITDQLRKTVAQQEDVISALDIERAQQDKAQDAFQRELALAQEKIATGQSERSEIIRQQQEKVSKLSGQVHRVETELQEKQYENEAKDFHVQKLQHEVRILETRQTDSIFNRPNVTHPTLLQTSRADSSGEVEELLRRARRAKDQLAERESQLRKGTTAVLRTAIAATGRSPSTDRSSENST